MLERKRGGVVRGRAALRVKGPFEFEVWARLVGRGWNLEPRRWVEPLEGEGSKYPEMVGGVHERGVEASAVGGANGVGGANEKRRDLETKSYKH